MTEIFENPDPSGKEAFKKWLETQKWMDEAATPMDCLLMILYRQHELEKRLNKIACNVKTHWVD